MKGIFKFTVKQKENPSQEGNLYFKSEVLKFVYLCSHQGGGEVDMNLKSLQKQNKKYLNIYCSCFM